MNDSILKIENLIFEYAQYEDGENVRAVDDVSLEIERGSFTAIIGRNGSGKSTLAKNINGLLLPTSGTVYVNGIDTCDESQIWEVRQTVGMVFQNPDNQLVSTIVEDDVAFGPENMGIAPEEIRLRVDEALKAVGMYEHRKKAPHLLSGGQKQRIAIAGAIAMKPECIRRTDGYARSFGQARCYEYNKRSQQRRYYGSAHYAFYGGGGFG